MEGELEPLLFPLFSFAGSISVVSGLKHIGSHYFGESGELARIDNNRLKECKGCSSRFVIMWQSF